MKTIFRTLAILSVLACYPLFAIGQSNTLQIVGEEFPPFEFKNEKGEAVGIDIDIATHIFSKLGVDFKVNLYTWSRAWEMAKSGQADAVLSTSRKDKRKPYLYYPEEDMWVSEYVFFTKKGKKQLGFNGYPSAKEGNYKIGVVRGYSYNDEFWTTFPNQADGNLNDQLKVTKNNVLNMKKLVSDRIDMVISDKTVGSYQAKKVGLLDQIDYYETPLFSKGYPMPFTKNSKYPDIENIAIAFEKELKAMKADGRYDEIVNKWIK